MRREPKQAAQETLLNRTLIRVSPEAYAEFLALLDAPPNPSARLVRVMNTTPPWERNGRQALATRSR
jgi:uncharacterized protein (DUF1778 family)